MREYNKIYSVRLYMDAINELEKKLKRHGNYEVEISKENDNLFELRLHKDGYNQFIITNTIDCLYCILDGYQRALYDNNIIK